MLAYGAPALLSRDLVLAKGEARIEIALAVEERGREFDLRATDVLTGASAALKR